VHKRITAACAIAALAFTAAASAAPTPGPVGGPGCFGQWRAGSVIALTEAGYTVGKDFFSERAGDNSTINADNRATCAALS
jgi:hypothetical protein